MRNVIGLTLAALFFAGTAFAGAPDKGKGKKPVPAPKMTDVTICPMTSEAVKGEGGGSEKYGKYNVHFCCPSCKPAFDKLSKKDKDKKIADALKKQKAAPKTSEATPTTQLTKVNVCPMTGEAVKGEGGGIEVYSNYEVHFCCAGCKPAFDKLSKEDKETKIAAALKK